MSSEYHIVRHSAIPLLIRITKKLSLVYHFISTIPHVLNKLIINRAHFCQVTCLTVLTKPSTHLLEHDLCLLEKAKHFF